MNQKSLWTFLGGSALLVTILSCGGGGGGPTTHEYAYLFSIASGSVYRYNVGHVGTLTYIDSFPAADENVRGAAVTHDGKYMYSVSANGAIGQYAIAADGTLTTIPNKGFGLNGVASSVAVTGDGKYVFVTIDNRAINQYIIGPDGSLSQNSPTIFAGASSPSQIVVSADSRHAYVSNTSDATISALNINADGTLSANGTPAPAATGPAALSLSLSGTYLYVACGGANLVSQYNIASDGSIAVMTDPTVPGPKAGSNLALSPVSGQVYVGASFGTDGIKRYAPIVGGPTPGELTEISPPFTSFPPHISSLTFSNQNYLYICNQDQKSISVLVPSVDGSLKLQQTINVSGYPQALVFVQR